MEARKNTRLRKLHKVTKGFGPMGYNADPVNLVSNQKQQLQNLRHLDPTIKLSIPSSQRPRIKKIIITVGFLL